MSTGSHLFLVIASILSQHGQAANILVAAMTFGSPWMSVAKIAEALASRGHVVTVVAPASEKNDVMRKWPTLSYALFGDPAKRSLMNDYANNDVPRIAFMTSAVEQYQTITPTAIAAMMDDCEIMLGDGELLTKLKNSHYDVVLAYPGLSCGHFVAQYLDLPLVCTQRLLPMGLDIRATGVPFPVSYVPTAMSSLTDRMTFLQRAMNVLMYVVSTTSGQLIFEGGFDNIAKRTIGANFTTAAALARTDVWLYQNDVMFDFPRPLMPNMVSIAGHMADDVKPLNQELEKFVQSSGDEGVVLVTFGSMIAHMPPEIADMLAAAFSRLPQKVVWRYAGEPPSSLGPNTKTMDWVPQVDLLAHPKMKAFVSHCGYNGVAEAMYHGVPLVGMPLMTDAHSNIARMVARGMAVSLDIHSVTSGEVYQAITAVISDPRYKKNANKVSAHLRDQPQSPMERAVWWTEHVIRHGGLPHLRSRAAELPFYQYYLLDVMAVILAALSAMLLTCLKCCSCVCGMCKKNTAIAKQKTN